jgi:Na+-transporting methylmalonyl-CoA/oxaloacetate decarboxylase gamma subunit
MFENLFLSIKITLIGMGMVFGAILLIWGLMGLLVRFASSSNEKQENEVLQADMERKRLAAIAAVMVALAQREDMLQPHEFPLPPTATVSPWQAIMRTRILNKRGRVR